MTCFLTYFVYTQTNPIPSILDHSDNHNHNHSQNHSQNPESRIHIPIGMGIAYAIPMPMPSSYILILQSYLDCSPRRWYYIISPFKPSGWYLPRITSTTVSSLLLLLSVTAISPQYCSVQSSPVLYRSVSYRIASYRIVLYSTVQYIVPVPCLLLAPHWTAKYLRSTCSGGGVCYGSRPRLTHYFLVCCSTPPSSPIPIHPQ